MKPHQLNTLLLVVLTLAGPSRGLAAESATRMPGANWPPDATLTDAAFFDALDLTRPGLEPVRAAMARQDLPAARQALAAYYAQRTQPTALLFNGSRPAVYRQFDRRAADELAAGTSAMRGQRGPLPMGAYQPHAVELACAYWWTGDPKYSAALASHLQQTARETAIANLHPISASVQVPNWIAAWQALREAAEFTPDQRIDVLKGLLARARWLDQNVEVRRGERTANVKWMIAGSALHAGIMFPEFKEAARWRERGLAGVELCLDQDIYPDGSQKELSTTYFGLYPQYLFGLGLLARQNGLPTRLLERPEGRRMVRYLAWMTKPDGSIPMLNDSDIFLTQQRIGGGQAYLEQTGIPELEAIGLADPAHHAVSATPRMLLQLGAELFDDPEIEYVASGGTRGAAPSTSQAFAHAGHAFQRTGWQPDDLYLAFDAGPYGRGHQHEDKLSIDVMAFGRNLIVDPGRYTYQGGTGFRGYIISTAAHSSVLVDGQGQRRAGLREVYETQAPLADFHWHSDRVFDDATGNYDSGYGRERDRSVSHAREVFFAKRARYWIVTDRLAGSRTATTQTLFQLAPGRVQRTPDRAAITFVTQNEAHRPTAGLLLDAGAGDLAEISVAEGAEQPFRGWYAPRMELKYPAPQVSFTRTGTLPRSNSTVLFPFAGEKAPEVKTVVVAVTDAAGSALPTGLVSALRIERPAHTDRFLSSAAAGRMLDCDGVRTDGSRAWVSCTAAGEVAAFVLMGGSRLELAGGVIVAAPHPLPAISGYRDGAVLHLEGAAAGGPIQVGAAAGVTEVRVNGRRANFSRRGAAIELAGR